MGKMRKKMNPGDIGQGRIDDLAQKVVSRLDEEESFLRRTGKALYLIFGSAGANYLRKIPHNMPEDIVYKLELVPGGTGGMRYIVQPLGVGKRMGNLTKAFIEELNRRASTESTFVQAGPWGIYPDTIVVRGMGRKRRGSF